MIVKTLKRTFSEALIDYYPETEIDSFFNLLAENVLKMKRIDVTLNLYAVVSGKKHNRFKASIDRLRNYEPIQYILEETEFYGLPFKVSQDTLIPRPETEELVDWILKLETSKNKEVRILDIGTGSGCIAISLAKHLPNAEVFALDVSSKALQIAKHNAQLNQVEITCIEKDILAPNIDFESLYGKFDIIVSNPPYVRQLEKAQMKPNVLENEPHLALFVDDENPLIFYKAISDFGINNLRKKGHLFFEINEYLGDDMIALLERNHFGEIELKQDLFGKDRMIKGEI